MEELFVAYHARLVEVHAALRAPLDALIAVHEPELAQRAAQMMSGHHHLESEVLFPALRRAMRSSDVGFLDAFDREHRAIHALVERLAAAPLADISAVAAELLARFVSHTQEEELGIGPMRLPAIVTAAELEVVLREVEARRSR